MKTRLRAALGSDFRQKIKNKPVKLGKLLRKVKKNEFSTGGVKSEEISRRPAKYFSIHGMWESEGKRTRRAECRRLKIRGREKVMVKWSCVKHKQNRAYRTEP